MYDESPQPTLSQARAAISAAKRDQRGLTPVEVATVLRAVPAAQRDAAYGLVNLANKSKDMRDVDRRDALATLLGNEPVESRETWEDRAAERRQAMDEFHAASDRIMARDTERAYDGADGPWLPGLGEYRRLQTEQRAIGTSGAFIPVQYHRRFFDQLRKRTAVLAAGPIMIPVSEAGSLKVPRVTASVTVSGIAEAGTISPSDPTVSDVTLDPKKFAAMTLVNREAVEDSNPNLRQVVANSLVKDLAVKLDEQLVTGDGTGQNLTGLRNISGFTAGASTGTNGGSLSYAFLADTLAAAETANLDTDSLAWIMHARSWGSVRKLQDTTNRPIVALDPTVGIRNSIFGRPVFLSNSLSITETVGTSTDCSTIMLVDMSQIVVGVAREIELVASEHFKFDADQVAVRVTARYDIAAPQPTAIVKTVGVRP